MVCVKNYRAFWGLKVSGTPVFKENVGDIGFRDKVSGKISPIYTLGQAWAWDGKSCPIPSHPMGWDTEPFYDFSLYPIPSHDFKKC